MYPRNPNKLTKQMIRICPNVFGRYDVNDVSKTKLIKRTALWEHSLNMNPSTNQIETVSDHNFSSDEEENLTSCNYCSLLFDHS